MKISKIIITLLIILIILLLIDLLTGIWYWNQVNLCFDSANFNNIVTPIFTIIATLLYAFTLNLAINQNKIVLNQNKIILSQNIKPYYEKQIENLLSKAKELKIDGEINIESESSNINGLNYIEAIQVALISLSKNDEYLIDSKLNSQNVKQTQEYFTTRSYYGKLLFLSQFTIPLNSATLLHQDIKLLIQEINIANLISEDKIILKKQIKRDLLIHYLAFISFMDKYSFLQPAFPLIFSMSGNIEFVHLNKTSFREHYDWFQIEFDEEELNIIERK